MRIAGIITLWLLAILLALPLDAPIARYMRDGGWETMLRRDHGLREFLKAPGEVPLVVVAAVVVCVFHRLHLRGALYVALATSAISVNKLIKWLVGRHRPFTWFREPDEQLRPFEFVPVRQGFFNDENLCFPSGHTALAFALAGALTMLWPRGRWLFFGVAILPAIERIAENAHWLSDVIAAMALGIGAAHVFGGLVCAGGVQRITPMTDELEQTSDTSAGVNPRRPVIIDPTPSSESPYLSLVIPAYNEQENIPTLLSRSAAAMASLARPFEIIIIDDGSTDNTAKLLADAMKQYPFLRVICMKRNGGQSAAFEAGFEAARGQIIATIDADLQNDPEEIPRLIPLLDEKNVDMITGWRKDRQDTPFRRWQSRQANRIRNWISQETVNDSASSLKIYRAHAVKGLKLFSGAHRFFPTLVKMRGCTCYETPVKHSPRFAGTAKYGFRNRAFRAFVDLLAVRWMKNRCIRYSAQEVRRQAPR